MFNKELNAISESDLLALVSDQIPEGRTLEYKRDLPGQKDSDKKEFLADISSFANTSGGDLIYGIGESHGVPQSIAGLNVADMDAEKLRLDNMAASGIEPRIRYNMRTVSCSAGTVLIIRVERSWFGPHRMVYQGSDKFFARNQAGKYPLDVGELRQAFTRGATIAQQTRALRIDRIIEVSNDRTPVPLSEGPRVLLHVFPFDSFGQGAPYDPVRFYRDPTRVPLLGSTLHLVRVNFDGVVVHNGNPVSTTYTQIFRSGVLEVANSRILDHVYDDRPLIPTTSFEKYLLDFIPSAFSLLNTMGIPPPVAIALTLLNVKGLEIWVDQWNSSPGFPISEDQLMLPEQIIDDFAMSPGLILKPAFDQIWNACGFEGTNNLNCQGEWIGGR